MRNSFSAAYKQTSTFLLLFLASFVFVTCVHAEEVETTSAAREISLPYGTSLDVLKAAIVPAAQASFEVYLPDGSTVASDLQDDYQVVVTAGDGVSQELYTVTFLPNTDASIISIIGKIDTEKNMINALPFGTTLADLRNAITPADQATFDIYQKDGTTLAGDNDPEAARGVAPDLQPGYKVVVIAGDQETTTSYTLAFAKNTETTLESQIGDVDHEAKTISNIPFGTELKIFKEGIRPAPEAIFEVYINAEKESRAGELREGYQVRIIAGDTTSQALYTIHFAPNTDATVMAKDETITIDEENKKITNVPFGILPKPFKDLMKPVEQAIYEVYEDEGASRLATKALKPGSSVMVIAGDTTTTKIYYLDFAPNKDAYVKTSLGVIEEDKKIIKDIPFGTTMEDFVAALETPEQSEFIIAGEDAKTPLTEFKGKKFYLTITAGDGETFRQYQLVFAPNTEATVTTELATVDNEAAIIKDIAFGTELKTLKTSIVPAPQAIFEIYKADGKTLAKELVSGYKLIAIAGDTTTITEYEIQMAPNTEATLSLSMDKLWELFKTQSPANPKAEAKKEEAKPEVKPEVKEEMKEEAEEKKEAETEEAKEDMSEEEMSDESASEEAGMTITLE